MQTISLDEDYAADLFLKRFFQMGKIFCHAPMEEEKKNYEHDDMLTHILLLRQNDMITYIPSNHGGSLKSSIEKIDFKSEVDSNFRRGAEEADTYFLPTG